MKLILEAIKALFRKQERNFDALYNELDANVYPALETAQTAAETALAGAFTVITVDSDNKASMTYSEIVERVTNGELLVVCHASRMYFFSSYDSEYNDATFTCADWSSEKLCAVVINYNGSIVMGNKTLTVKT